MTPALVGMIHLPALPGTATHQGKSVADIAAAAVEDGRHLAEAGFDAALLQNSLDRPTRTRVDAACVAQMTVIAQRVIDECGLPLGINIHKNDGPSALAVAAAVGALFIRVKVLTGTVIGAEGLINGCALETLSLRTRLAGRTQIWADVHELTSRPLAGDDFISAAVDAATFGAADALIVTRPTIDESRESVRILRDHVPHVPLIIGGGIDKSTVAEALDEGDGVIIGRALKPDGSINGPVDMLRATEIAVAAGRGRIGPTPRDRPPRDRR